MWPAVTSKKRVVSEVRKPSTTDFRGLAAFSKFIGSRKRKPQCLLVSFDEYIQNFENGVAIPFSKLWEYLGRQANTNR
jgi:hypothetical protein